MKNYEIEKVTRECLREVQKIIDSLNESLKFETREASLRLGRTETALVRTNLYSKDYKFVFTVVGNGGTAVQTSFLAEFRDGNVSIELRPNSNEIYMVFIKSGMHPWLGEQNCKSKEVS